MTVIGREALPNAIVDQIRNRVASRLDRVNRYSAVHPPSIV